jgi:uncharacterized protein DUF2252
MLATQREPSSAPPVAACRTGPAVLRHRSWPRARDDAGAEHDDYIRQLWDGKGSAIVELMEPMAMRAYPEMRRWSTRMLARAMSSLSRAYLGSGDAFDLALASFAEDHADQTSATTRPSGPPSTLG